jgi:hypothetical protein
MSNDVSTGDNGDHKFDQNVSLQGARPQAAFDAHHII